MNAAIEKCFHRVISIKDGEEKCDNAKCGHVFKKTPQAPHQHDGPCVEGCLSFPGEISCPFPR